MRSESVISVYVIRLASSIPLFKPYTNDNKILSLWNRLQNRALQIYSKHFKALAFTKYKL